MKEKQSKIGNVRTEGTTQDYARELKHSDFTWEERPGVVIPEKDITHFANASYNVRTQREVFPVIKPEFRHLLKQDENGRRFL